MESPGILASLVGTPLLHAGHTGKLEGGFLTLPGTRLNVVTRTQLTGETQIIDGSGSLVACLKPEHGKGVITADIALGRQAPRAQIPDRFWTPPKLGLGYALWIHQNACGKNVYRWAKRTGRLRAFDFRATTDKERR